MSLLGERVGLAHPEPIPDMRQILAAIGKKSRSTRKAWIPDTQEHRTCLDLED